MAAAGMDWILNDHPHRKDKNLFPHLILPALTAAAIGFPLGLLKPGAEWWIILGLGSLLIVLVLLSEYISLEPTDIRYPLALMVLSGTSYSLLLILSIALRSAGIRLYLTSAPSAGGLCIFQPAHSQLPAGRSLALSMERSHHFGRHTDIDRALLLAAFAGALWAVPFRPGVCHDRNRSFTGGEPRPAQCLPGTADGHGHSVDPGDLHWITAQPF